MAQDPVMRLKAAPRRMVRLEPEVGYRLEIFKAKNRLGSSSAAAHVLLSRALGLSDPLPAEPDATNRKSG